MSAIRLSCVALLLALGLAECSSDGAPLAERDYASKIVGQWQGTVGDVNEAITFGADGKFEANPDTALMQFNISAQEATSREAYDHASKSAEQVRQILRSNGIEPKSAEIG